MKACISQMDSKPHCISLAGCVGSAVVTKVTKIGSGDAVVMPLEIQTREVKINLSVVMDKTKQGL